MSTFVSSSVERSRDFEVHQEDKDLRGVVQTVILLVNMYGRSCHRCACHAVGRIKTEKVTKAKK